MVTGDVSTVTPDLTSNLLTSIGDIGLWLQAIGIIAILWVVLSIINWIINSRRLRLLSKITEDMKRIEGKIDRLAKKSR